jgi:hypothetical protein
MTTAAAAFLRFSRDKRGYEHFYLVQSSTNRRGKTRARILYWFRTPPGVKVGRLPFSEDVQRAIEAQNPGVVFDWKRLLATPIPPPAPDVERWRERRRLEKAEKAARRAMLTSDSEAESAESAESGAAEPAEASTALEVSAAESPELSGSAPVENVESSEPGQAPIAPDPAGAQPGRKRRRRRRGGRRDRGACQGPANAAPPSSNQED